MRRCMFNYGSTKFCTYSHVDECLVEEQHPLIADRHLHTTALGITIELQNKRMGILINAHHHFFMSSDYLRADGM